MTGDACDVCICGTSGWEAMATAGGASGVVAGAIIVTIGAKGVNGRGKIPAGGGGIGGRKNRPGGGPPKETAEASKEVAGPDILTM